MALNKIFYNQWVFDAIVNHVYHPADSFICTTATLPKFPAILPILCSPSLLEVLIPSHCSKCSKFELLFCLFHKQNVLSLLQPSFFNSSLTWSFDFDLQRAKSLPSIKILSSNILQYNFLPTWSSISACGLPASIEDHCSWCSWWLVILQWTYCCV